MREVFAAIAKQENGEFKVTDATYNGFRGAKVFVSYYHLETDYKMHRISIDYEMGNHNMAKIEMQLLPGEAIPELSITNRSHYYRLFYRKANILKVESTNITFKRYVENLLFSTNLEMLARENLFQPKMVTSLNENRTKSFITEFHLAFENKRDVLYALIAFYKGIIDSL
ncbi:hypothetical protein GWA97_04585 [Flavobacterium sp. LaA7.5]|nr:hypothetical protein [Flavobacterium salilacus subsp. altitudinum]